MSASPTAALIQEIDDEILELRRSIFARLERRSALLPATRLPPEILSAIFHLYVHSFHGMPFRTVNDVSPFTWVAGVTHTCRSWRHVALGTPTLWTHIPVRRCKPEMIMEFLDRSCNASLVVDIRSSPVYKLVDQRRLRTLQPAFSRIEMLNLQLKEEEYCDLFYRLPEPATNSLRSLRLSGETVLSFFEATLLPHHVITTLEHLEICGYGVDWRLPDLFPKTLTRLSICESGGYQPSVIARGVSGLVALRELELQRVLLPDDPTTFGSVEKKVHLPYMADVTLRDYGLLSAFHLLGHFQLPPRHHVKLNDLHTGPEELKAKLLALKTLVSDVFASQGPICRISLNLNCGELSFQGADAQTGAIQMLEFKFDCREIRGGPFLDIFSAICASLKVYSVYDIHLTLGGPDAALDPTHIELLLQTLQPMRDVHTLSISNAPGQTQDTPLNATLMAILGRQLQDGAYLLPNLRRLVLGHLDVHAPAGSGRAVDVDVGSGELLQDLREVLETRRRAGFDLEVMSYST
ncbi:hypothetical protein EIP91_006450 [Steccherinum ochraceum]|uniref:Uncharacterized protein n=1 Tax=Steccherinum ochraceum TaxID=92696 RepID=A0A4R0R5W1_9APHY|nr:hypothetical protein EIP91_006450 [Steccherinum ochraceum]